MQRAVGGSTVPTAREPAHGNAPQRWAQANRGKGILAGLPAASVLPGFCSAFFSLLEGFGTVLLQRPGQRRVWLKGTSTQPEEERAVGMRIIFFGGDRAGETQQPTKGLTQPASHTALSCLTPALAPGLNFGKTRGENPRSLTSALPGSREPLGCWGCSPLQTTALH